MTLGEHQGAMRLFARLIASSYRMDNITVPTVIGLVFVADDWQRKAFTKTKNRLILFTTLPTARSMRSFLE